MCRRIQTEEQQRISNVTFFYFQPITTEICLTAGIFLDSFLYKSWRGWWLFVIRKFSYSTRYSIINAFQEPWIVYRNHLCHCPHLGWIYSLNIAYLNQIQITYLFEKCSLLCKNSWRQLYFRSNFLSYSSAWSVFAGWEFHLKAQTSWQKCITLKKIWLQVFVRLKSRYLEL